MTAPAWPGTGPKLDDDAPEPTRGPSGLIVNIDAYRATVPTVIPWVVKPIAYSGGVTLVSGPPRAGKSTLAAQLQSCRETGERLYVREPPRHPRLLSRLVIAAPRRTESDPRGARSSGSGWP